MSNPNRATSSGLWRDPALAVQCGCTALVALGAAYASYHHGREFALHFGADHTTAAIWPLIVDGLLMIATVELWKPADTDRTQGHWTAWLAFHPAVVRPEQIIRRRRAWWFIGYGVSQDRQKFGAAAVGVDGARLGQVNLVATAGEGPHLATAEFRNRGQGTSPRSRRDRITNLRRRHAFESPSGSR